VITEPARVPIGRRAWIGDGRRGASLAPDGTLDWYASGGLTADPDLWCLLDDSGPAVRVGPRRDSRGAAHHLPPSDLAYRPGTNVVATVSEGAGGRRLSVTDFVPWAGAGGVIRLIRALSGPVEVELEVMTGPDRRPKGGSRPIAPTGSGLLLDGLPIHSPVPLEADPLDRDRGRWRALFHLDSGEEAAVAIGVEHPVGPDAARRLLADTETAWRSWLSTVGYSGPYRAAVERALLSVRTLTGPGGAPAGAGTTSLPRRVGSERSTDDRWVRLREVAEAVPVLSAAGLPEDAEAAEAWLRRTLTDAHLPWPAWFDADGQPVPEFEEQAFEGWRRSGPVGHGRALLEADHGQAGVVTAAIGASMRGPGGRSNDPGPLSAAFEALAGGADWAADHWREPDSGRWEIARPARVYVAGRVSAWSALERMAALARSMNPLSLQAAGWKEDGREIRSWLESDALARDGGLRIDDRSDDADAALLEVAWSGPWPPQHPVVQRTVARVLERLSSGPFLYRYSDRVTDDRVGPDLPDLEASLMAVRALASLERWDEAHERMEAIVGVVARAGSGLLSETADPVSGQLYGNFPSTGASLALVAAAFALAAGPR
jgi:GH15 family glucan-1,4-alpha-glucosidase